jgi:hypothetical protein
MLLPILVIRAIHLHSSLVQHLLVGPQHGFVISRGNSLIIDFKDRRHFWGLVMASIIG